MYSIRKTVDINAHIENLRYEVKVAEGVPVLWVSFVNLGDGTITAIKFTAHGYNSFGDKVQVDGKDDFPVIIQDIRIEKNMRANELRGCISDASIRKIELEECQVCYEDNRVLRYEGKNIKVFNVQYLDAHADEELIQSIEEEFGTKFEYIPQDSYDGWICGCGRYNRPTDEICSYCENDKEQVFKLTDENYRAELVEAHRKSEKKRREEKVAAKKRLKKVEVIHRIKVVMGWLVTIASIFAIVMVLFIDTSSDSLIDNNNKYKNETLEKEDGYSALEVSDVKITSNSLYVVCSGTMKNTGKNTYKFVKVKCAFKDSEGNVIDTSWTYATGVEGLEPGESTKFELSVKKDSRITSCIVSILDFN